MSDVRGSLGLNDLEVSLGVLSDIRDLTRLWGSGRVMSDVWDSALGLNGVGGWAGLLTDVRVLAGVGGLSNNWSGRVMFGA